MWVEKRKPKTLVSEEIPDDLALYLEEVHREILTGEETATLESDDLLQYEEFDYAYGGLINSETGEYRFQYYTDDENGSTWGITLSKEDIEKIVNGKITELSLWACKHPRCGCKFSGEDDFCSNCDEVEQART